MPKQRLFWDMLVAAFGTDTNLAEHIDALVDVRDEDRNVVELARRYRQGWRPDDF